MRRTSPVYAVLGICILGTTMVACGDDETSSSGPAPTTPSSPPPASTPTRPSAPPGQPGGYEHGAGPDDVVLEVSQVGGIAAPDEQFRDLPWLVVTGDGRAIGRGPTSEIHPGPLLPNLLERSIGDDGIQRLLALADVNGLLDDIEYAEPEGVYDAPTTVVRITAGGETYAHAAYALGSTADGEEDPARIALDAFVEDVAGELTDIVGSGELGPEAPYESDVFLVRARARSGVTTTGGTVEWPDGAPDLAGIGECAEVSVRDVVDVVEAADFETEFRADGVDYVVDVVPRLPGRGC